jgi:hypothetical protein
MKDMDGAVAALAIIGSLAVAHEVIRRDRRYGSLSTRSIPLVIFGYVLDADSAIEAPIRYMGAKVFENQNVHYTFRVGVDGDTPSGRSLLKEIMPINRHQVYQVDLIPTELVLHDGPILKDTYGELIRSIYGGQKNFNAVLEKIKPDQVAVTVLFPPDVEPTLENVEIAKIGLLSSLSSAAFDGNRAYGWLLCDIKNPKKLDLR